MPKAKAASALRDLGLSDMEVKAYVALAEHGPLSGYALARLLARANANTYTALEWLERRNAVVASAGSPKIYRAVSTDELLAALRRDFESSEQRVREELVQLSRRELDDGTYRLHYPEQVLERARCMLAESKGVAIVDAFPEALGALRDDISAAQRRHVSVIVKAYAPIALRVKRLIIHPRGEDIVAQYKGDQWLNVSIDGKEALVSLLEGDFDGVRHAMWTQSPYVAWTFHCGLACEVGIAVLDEMASETPDARLREAYPHIHEVIFKEARGYLEAGFKKERP